MKPFLMALVATATMALPAAAQTQRDCDTFEANARNIYGPYSETIREFANGAIRVIALDVGEPAWGSEHVMVTYPLPDEPFPACALISWREGTGFANMNMAGLAATYDPARGLVIALRPDVIVGGDMIFTADLTITVNQAEGSVVATLTGDPLAPATPPPGSGAGEVLK